MRVGEGVIAAFNKWQQRDLGREPTLADFALDVAEVGAAALENDFYLACVSAVLAELALHLDMSCSTKLQPGLQLPPERGVIGGTGYGYICGPVIGRRCLSDRATGSGDKRSVCIVAVRRYAIQRGATGKQQAQECCGTG
jgi:hypothetical protein